MNRRSFLRSLPAIAAAIPLTAFLRPIPPDPGPAEFAVPAGSRVAEAVGIGEINFADHSTHLVLHGRRLRVALNPAHGESFQAALDRSMAEMRERFRIETRAMLGPHA